MSGSDQQQDQPIAAQEVFASGPDNNDPPHPMPITEFLSPPDAEYAADPSTLACNPARTEEGTPISDTACNSNTIMIDASSNDGFAPSASTCAEQTIVGPGPVAPPPMAPPPPPPPPMAESSQLADSLPALAPAPASTEPSGVLEDSALDAPGGFPTTASVSNGSAPTPIAVLGASEAPPSAPAAAPAAGDADFDLLFSSPADVATGILIDTGNPNVNVPDVACDDAAQAQAQAQAQPPSETDSDDDDDDGLLEPFPTRPFSDDPEDATLIIQDDAADQDQDQDRAEQQQPADDEDGLLRPGDHVCTWIKRQQRHGIVLSVGDGLLTEVDPKDCDADAVTIVTFYNNAEASSSSQGRSGSHSASADDYAGGGGASYSSLALGDASDDDDGDDYNGDGNAGVAEVGMETNDESIQGHGQHADVAAVSLRTFLEGDSGDATATAKKKKNVLKKVSYGSAFGKRLLSRPGSVTAVKADLPGLVVARARYLLENPGSLPPYHRMSANGECASVWCRIGRFLTLQGSSMLQIMFFGQAGGAVAGGVVASNLMFWAPMPGLWGAVGWWWYVPATVAYPFLIPVLVTFGLASLLPLEILRRYRKRWKKSTVNLNRDFWMAAEDDVKVEFFGTTSTTDEDWMRKFFGVKDEEAEDEAEHGQYMPLDGEGGDEDDDDDEDDLGRRYQESMASAYKYDSSGGQEDGRVKTGMQGLLKKWTNKSDSGRNIAGGEDMKGDDAAPLTREQQQAPATRQRSSMMRKWRDSWTNRGSGSEDSLVQEAAGGKGVDPGGINYRDYDHDVDVPASQGLMS